MGLLHRLSIKVETALQSEVSALLAQSDAVAALLYPGEYRRPITAETLAKPGIFVLVARLGDEAVGLCVLFDRGDRTMELKRMIVDAESRGAGIGLALLAGAEAQALALKAQTMMLEVGIRNIEAQRLYRRAGYKSCGPFPPYSTNPVSLFMNRPLAEAVSSI